MYAIGKQNPSGFSHGLAYREVKGKALHTAKKLDPTNATVFLKASILSAYERTEEPLPQTTSSHTSPSVHGREGAMVSQRGSYDGVGLSRGPAGQRASPVMQTGALQGIGAWTQDDPHGTSKPCFGDGKDQCHTLAFTGIHIKDQDKPLWHQGPNDVPFAPFQLLGSDKVADSRLNENKTI